MEERNRPQTKVIRRRKEGDKIKTTCMQEGKTEKKERRKKELVKILK